MTDDKIILDSLDKEYCKKAVDSQLNLELSKKSYI